MKTYVLAIPGKAETRSFSDLPSAIAAGIADTPTTGDFYITEQDRKTYRITRDVSTDSEAEVG